MSKLHHKPTIRVFIDESLGDDYSAASIMEVIEKEGKRQAKIIDSQIWTRYKKNPKPSEAQIWDWYENHSRWVRRVIIEIFGDRICKYHEFSRDCWRYKDPEDPEAWESMAVTPPSPVKIQSLANWSKIKQ